MEFKQNLLAFGDSIVSGTHAYGVSQHSFGIKLQDALRSRSIKVAVEGVKIVLFVSLMLGFF
jgi:hypothetical protein